MFLFGLYHYLNLHPNKSNYLNSFQLGKKFLVYPSKVASQFKEQKIVLHFQDESKAYIYNNGESPLLFGKNSLVDAPGNKIMACSLRDPALKEQLKQARILKFASLNKTNLKDFSFWSHMFYKISSPDKKNIYKQLLVYLPFNQSHNKYQKKIINSIYLDFTNTSIYNQKISTAAALKKKKQLASLNSLNKKNIFMSLSFPSTNFYKSASNKMTAKVEKKKKLSLNPEEIAKFARAVHMTNLFHPFEPLAPTNSDNNPVTSFLPLLTPTNSDNNPITSFPPFASITLNAQHFLPLFSKSPLVKTLKNNAETRKNIKKLLINNNENNKGYYQIDVKNFFSFLNKNSDYSNLHRFSVKHKQFSGEYLLLKKPCHYVQEEKNYSLDKLTPNKILNKLPTFKTLNKLSKKNSKKKRFINLPMIPFYQSLLSKNKKFDFFPQAKKKKLPLLSMISWYDQPIWFSKDITQIKHDLQLKNLKCLSFKYYSFSQSILFLKYSHARLKLNPDRDWPIYLDMQKSRNTFTYTIPKKMYYQLKQSNLYKPKYFSLYVPENFLKTKFIKKSISKHDNDKIKLLKKLFANQKKQKKTANFDKKFSNLSFYQKLQTKIYKGFKNLIFVSEFEKLLQKPRLYKLIIRDYKYKIFLVEKMISTPPKEQKKPNFYFYKIYLNSPLQYTKIYDLMLRNTFAKNWNYGKNIFSFSNFPFLKTIFKLKNNFLYEKNCFYPFKYNDLKFDFSKNHSYNEVKFFIFDNISKTSNKKLLPFKYFNFYLNKFSSQKTSNLFFKKYFYFSPKNLDFSSLIQKDSNHKNLLSFGDSTLKDEKNNKFKVSIIDKNYERPFFKQFFISENKIVFSSKRQLLYDFDFSTHKDQKSPNNFNSLIKPVYRFGFNKANSILPFFQFRNLFPRLPHNDISLLQNFTFKKPNNFPTHENLKEKKLFFFSLSNIASDNQKKNNRPHVQNQSKKMFENILDQIAARKSGTFVEKTKFVDEKLLKKINREVTEKLSSLSNQNSLKTKKLNHFSNFKSKYYSLLQKSLLLEYKSGFQEIFSLPFKDQNASFDLSYDSFHKAAAVSIFPKTLFSFKKNINLIRFPFWKHRTSLSRKLNHFSENSENFKLYTTNNTSKTTKTYFQNPYSILNLFTNSYLIHNQPYNFLKSSDEIKNFSSYFLPWEKYIPLFEKFSFEGFPDFLSGLKVRQTSMLDNSTFQSIKNRKIDLKKNFQQKAKSQIKTFYKNIPLKLKQVTKLQTIKKEEKPQNDKEKYKFQIDLIRKQVLNFNKLDIKSYQQLVEKMQKKIKREFKYSHYIRNNNAINHFIEDLPELGKMLESKTSIPSVFLKTNFLQKKSNTNDTMLSFPYGKNYRFINFQKPVSPLQKNLLLKYSSQSLKISKLKTVYTHDFDFSKNFYSTDFNFNQNVKPKLSNFSFTSLKRQSIDNFSSLLEKKKIANKLNHYSDSPYRENMKKSKISKISDSNDLFNLVKNTSLESYFLNNLNNKKISTNFSKISSREKVLSVYTKKPQRKSITKEGKKFLILQKKPEPIVNTLIRSNYCKTLEFYESPEYKSSYFLIYHLTFQTIMIFSTLFFMEQFFSKLLPITYIELNRNSFFGKLLPFQMRSFLKAAQFAYVIKEFQYLSEKKVADSIQKQKLSQPSENRLMKLLLELKFPDFSRKKPYKKKSKKNHFK